MSNRNSNNAIRARIRTNGSNCGNYYQEFEYFFNELASFAYHVDSMKMQNKPINETQSIIQKKLSIFNKFKK